MRRHNYILGRNVNEVYYLKIAYRDEIAQMLKEFLFMFERI